MEEHLPNISFIRVVFTILLRYLYLFPEFNNLPARCNPMTRVLPKNNPHFCILLTEGSILQSHREGGLTLYKAVHAILSNIRTTTWWLDYYQKTLTMQKPLCSCGWCIYNHHNKFKVMNISCTHSNYHWLKLTYLISVWSISAPRSTIFSGLNDFKISLR